MSIGGVSTWTRVTPEGTGGGVAAASAARSSSRAAFCTC